MNFNEIIKYNVMKPIIFSLSFLLAGIPDGTQDIIFYDLAQDQGLDFVHDHGGSGEKYYVEKIDDNLQKKIDDVVRDDSLHMD